jgi:hypothetical protein
MAYLKALLGFTKYSPGRLRDFAMWIYVSMNGNPHFPNPPVSMETLLTKIEVFSPAIAATMDGSRTAFAERNKQFKELRKTLVQIGHFVESAAPDVTAFITSGYELGPSSRKQAPPLSKSIRNLDWGDNSGTFRFRFMAVEAADSYEVRWALQLPDGTPGDWTTKPFGKTKGYLTFDGFTPGKIYLFQVRALLHTNYTDWSDPVMKMSL